jgi:hypothetical protein
MPLFGGLLHIDLTFSCPHCDHALVKKGGWFQVVRGFTCDECQRQLVLGYDDEAALFDRCDDNVAGLIAFLCGPCGDDINGSALPIDGAWAAGR